MIAKRDLQRPAVRIGAREIGASPCFVIAEAGVNHNGDPALARRLVDLAAEAGADAVKFQTFKAELVISATAPKAAYQQAATGKDGSQLDLIRSLELSFEDFAALQAHCRERSVIFLSTPFDHDSVDFLRGLELPAFKVPSGEITNHALLTHIGDCGKPLILSTGMSSLQEVDEAVAVVEASACPGLAVLHCVSSYPADPADVNLRAMATLSQAFGWPVGLSDHTTGCEIAFAAVALGATVIEKHFTLDKTLPGPDHPASLAPAELKALVTGIRRVEAALGDGIKAPRPSETDTRAVARRSLFLREGLRSGQPITADSLVALRPSGGIGPERLAEVLGRQAARDMASGTRISWSDLV